MVKKNSTCCEIGIWKGEFSQNILKLTNPKKLHLVDPWKFMPEYSQRWYGGKIASSQVEMDEVFDEVKQKFAGDKRVVIHKSTSKGAVKKFDDDYFDFIYVDGDHSYEAVLSDLNNYYPKLRDGGLLAGDDYFWGIREGLPVRRAVKKFCRRNNLDYKLLGTQFLIIKQ